MGEQVMKTIDGGITIDIGTQETSVVLMSLEGKIEGGGVVGNFMVPDLPLGHNEQEPMAWLEAVKIGMAALRQDLALHGKEIGKCYFVIVCGQMHGEVIMTHEGCVPTARLWCDARNVEEGEELTKLFGTKVPTRMTIARWLATTRERPEIAKNCVGITTPAGWVTYNLCGVHTLGVGDASGMFPIDVSTGNYRVDLMERFDAMMAHIGGFPMLRAILPVPVKAGEFIGTLNSKWAEILGLPQGTPICPPEGDQPAVLAGTYISCPGQGGGSWGTSICVNWISDRPFVGVNPAIDHFCDPMGRPINMGWLKNGTTFANAVITLLQMARGDEKDDNTYAFVIPEASQAPADCGGLRALPLMQTEPATEFVESAVAMFAGIVWEKVDGKVVTNLTPGNMYRAAFTSSVMNARLGLEVLREQGCPAQELVLTGGVLKTKTSTQFAAQLIASALNITVRVLPGGAEGTAFGGGLLGLFALRRQEDPSLEYGAFLDGMLGNEKGETFQPNAEDAETYDRMYGDHLAMLKYVEPELICSLEE